MKSLLMMAAGAALMVCTLGSSGCVMEWNSQGTVTIHRERPVPEPVTYVPVPEPAIYEPAPCPVPVVQEPRPRIVVVRRCPPPVVFSPALRLKERIRGALAGKG